MSNEQKLLPCPCGSTCEGSPYQMAGEMFRMDCERAECGWCVISPSREQCRIDWNTRAAQPVAVEGMLEATHWACENEEGETVLIDRWDVAKHMPGKCESLYSHDAFTAWLSKASMGLPERKSYSQSSLDMTEHDYTVSGFNDCLDAVQPLVAQLQREARNDAIAYKAAIERQEELRAERDAAAEVAQERGVALDTYLPLLNEVIEGRDALRAEVELLRDEVANYSLTVGSLGDDLDKLNLANAELAGLLREVVTNPGKVMIPLDLWKRIDALLASAGGGE